eukprot:11939987-Prorocentrum_lima.AAC.1
MAWQTVTRRGKKVQSELASEILASLLQGAWHNGGRGKGKGKGAEGKSSKEQEWICSSCRCNNWATREACRGCG